MTTKSSQKNLFSHIGLFLSAKLLVDPERVTRTKFEEQAEGTAESPDKDFRLAFCFGFTVEAFFIHSSFSFSLIVASTPGISHSRLLLFKVL